MQYHAFGQIKDLHAQTDDQQYPFIVFVNFMSVMTGWVCFGLPGTPVIVSSVSLPVALIIWKVAPGALACFERTSMLVTLLAIPRSTFTNSVYDLFLTNCRVIVCSAVGLVMQYHAFHDITDLKTKTNDTQHSYIMLVDVITLTHS